MVHCNYVGLARRSSCTRGRARGRRRVRPGPCGTGARTEYGLPARREIEVAIASSASARPGQPGTQERRCESADVLWRLCVCAPLHHRATGDPALRAHHHVVILVARVFLAASTIADLNHLNEQCTSPAADAFAYAYLPLN